MIDYGSISIRQGKFELCGNTVIGKSDQYQTHKAKVTVNSVPISSEWDIHSTELEICEWFKSDDKSHKYTIVSFKYYQSENCYQLISCCDRLNAIGDWQDFGILVDRAYEILNKNNVDLV